LRPSSFALLSVALSGAKRSLEEKEILDGKAASERRDASIAKENTQLQREGRTRYLRSRSFAVRRVLMQGAIEPLARITQDGKAAGKSVQQDIGSG